MNMPEEHFTPVNGPYRDQLAVERDLRHALPAHAELDDPEESVRLWVAMALKAGIELGAADLAAIHEVSAMSPLLGFTLYSVAVRTYNAGALTTAKRSIMPKVSEGAIN
jgi:hypothetical protein